MTLEMPTDENPVVVVEGDCLDVLRALPDGCVDAVVTDPPFGVRSEDWDDMDAHEFARFSMAWLSESRRLSHNLVSFFASGSEFFRLCEFVYPRCRQLIWHKPLGSQYAGASECRMWFAYEPIAHCYTREKWEVVQPKETEVARLLREARESRGMSRGGVDMAIRGKKTGLCFRWEESACLPTPQQVAKLKAILPLNGAFDSAVRDAYAARDEVKEKAAEKAAEKADVLSYRTITNGEHPCEKPVSLLADLIRCTTDPGDIILDPFAGSGTTGVAAIAEGRRAILVEKEPKYAGICRRRVAEAMGLGEGSLLKTLPAPSLFGESS